MQNLFARHHAFTAFAFAEVRDSVNDETFGELEVELVHDSAALASGKLHQELQGGDGTKGAHRAGAQSRPRADLVKHEASVRGEVVRPTDGQGQIATRLLVGSRRDGEDLRCWNITIRVRNKQTAKIVHSAEGIEVGPESFCDSFGNRSGPHGVAWLGGP